MMKPALALLSILFFILGCGGNSSNADKEQLPRHSGKQQVWRVRNWGWTTW